MRDKVRSNNDVFVVASILFTLICSGRKRECEGMIAKEVCNGGTSELMFS